MASLIIEKPTTQTPIDLATTKTFLRVSNTDDDALISVLIDAATESAEAFCNRSFCAKGYRQGLDSFPYFIDTTYSQQAYPPAYYALSKYSTTMWNYSQMIKLYAPPVISVDRISYLAASDEQWHDLLPVPQLWYPGQVVALGTTRIDNNANVQTCTQAGTTNANPPTWNKSLAGFTDETTNPDDEGTGPVIWQNSGPFPAALDNGSDQFGSFYADLDSEPARIFPGPGTVNWPQVLYVPNSVQIHFTAGYSTDGSLVPNRVKTAIMQTVALWYENREPVVPGSVNELPQHCQMLLWSCRVLDMSPTIG
jgi:hypothetical protein